MSACCPQGQPTNDLACVAPAGATVADNRYFTLMVVTAGQVLGVPVGSNAQVFLKPAAPIVQPLFAIMGQDGQLRFTNQPTVTLPPINPPVSGSGPFPTSPGFSSLIVASGADPQTMYALRAPTSGNYILQSINGSWATVEASSIPGINEVGQSAAVAAKGNIMVLVADPDNAGAYLVQKLAVVENRVIVGDVTGGVGGYMVLADSDPLFHPKGKFTGLTFRTVKGLDSDGNEISGGFDQVVTTGGGAVTDAYGLVYSPTSNRLYKAADQAVKFVSNNTSVSINTTSTVYISLPGGHGNIGSVNVNYPNVLIFFQVKLTADTSPLFAIFRDGVLLAEFPTNTTSDTSIQFVDTAVPFGVHVYDLRYKRGSTAIATSTLYYSSGLAATLGA